MYTKSIKEMSTQEMKNVLFLYHKKFEYENEEKGEYVTLYVDHEDVPESVANSKEYNNATLPIIVRDYYGEILDIWNEENANEWFESNSDFEAIDNGNSVEFEAYVDDSDEMTKVNMSLADFTKVFVKHYKTHSWFTDLTTM